MTRDEEEPDEEGERAGQSQLPGASHLVYYNSKPPFLKLLGGGVGRGTESEMRGLFFFLKAKSHFVRFDQ